MYDSLEYRVPDGWVELSAGDIIPEEYLFCDEMDGRGWGYGCGSWVGKFAPTPYVYRFAKRVTEIVPTKRAYYRVVRKEDDSLVLVNKRTGKERELLRNHIIVIDEDELGERDFNLDAHYVDDDSYRD